MLFVSGSWLLGKERWSVQAAYPQFEDYPCKVSATYGWHLENTTCVSTFVAGVVVTGPLFLLLLLHYWRGSLGHDSVLIDLRSCRISTESTACLRNLGLSRIKKNMCWFIICDEGFRSSKIPMKMRILGWFYIIPVWTTHVYFDLTESMTAPMAIEGYSGCTKQTRPSMILVSECNWPRGLNDFPSKQS